MIFFEGITKYHPLDYKFYKTRLVDLNIEYNCIQLSSSSSFFLHSSIKNENFKEGIFNGEDTLFINKILLNRPKMGLIKEAVYYYRKRRDFSSAVQNKLSKKEYYFSIIKSVDQYLIDKSKLLYNKVLPFIQFYIAYNSLFRIVLPTDKYLDKEQFKLYCESIEYCLRQIEDKYIIQQRIMSLKQKLLLLSRKYMRDIRFDIVFENQSLFYSGQLLLNLNNNKGTLIWRILIIKNNILHLEGKDNLFLNYNTFFYYCKVGDKIIFPRYLDCPGYDINTMFEIIKGRVVVFDIPIEKINNQTINFFCFFKDKYSEIFPSFGWFTHIPDLVNGYYNSGEYIIKIINGRIMIYKYNISLEEIFEKKYCEELKKIKKINLLKYRNNYFKYKNEFFKNKSSIWLINDRLNYAGDNGEYFFRYLQSKKPNNIDFYFVINSNCSDYKRLKVFDNIIEYGSEMHLTLFLRADKILSSVTEVWAENPFNEDYKYIRDLIHFDFIYIQSGIIKDDLSNFINRISKNYSLIITSSIKEYNSILMKKYAYNDNNVIITGLPRFDNLQRSKKVIKIEKILTILPTWRMFIKGTYDFKSYENIYSSTFKSTDFYNFYNSLINNVDLLSYMEKYNYIGIFCLHPYFSSQFIDFNQNKFFNIKEVCDYQNLILKSSLLVTDYSSIFFDFSYLEKPVIYAHFDYEEYRNNHYPKGYFDYIKHGFGPVCYDLNCTINNIIMKLKNNCTIENKYLKKIKRFFKYVDDKNCERLYSSLQNYSSINFSHTKRNLLYIGYFLLLILIKYKYF